MKKIVSKPTLIVLSLLSLINFIFFIFYIISVYKKGNITANPDEVDSVFRSISKSPLLITGISISLFIYALSMLHSYMGYKMGKFERKMFSISSLFGGIGIHLFFIKKRVKDKESKKRIYMKKASLVTSILSISALIIIQPILLFYYVFSNSLESEYSFQKISFSTIQGNENLIEIFSDGLDRKNNKDNFVNDAHFKDFVYFDKFMQGGPLTDISLPITWGGFAKYNLLANKIKLHNQHDKDYESEAYSKYFYESLVNEHFKNDKTYFNKTTLINPVNVSRSKSYATSTTGDVRELKKDGINGINWVTARESLKGSFGISKSSPDLISYKWLRSNKSSNINNSKKGARVMINDMFTHRPYLIGKEGSSLRIHQDDSYSNKAVPVNIAKTIDFLKRQKDSHGNSVYDNSMIVIYGDHHSHSNHVVNPNDASDNEFGESRSMLFVKYPRSVQQQIKIINDKLIYSGQLNAIIEDYFKSNRSLGSKYQYDNSLITSASNNERFSPDREIPSIFRSKYFKYKFLPNTPSDVGNYSKYKLNKIGTVEFGDSLVKMKNALANINLMKGLE